MGSTRLTRYINAPRPRVYATLLDRDADTRWKVPDGMTATVHAFEPHEGGAIRISLTYLASDAQGKSSDHTDTYHGRFVELALNERIVEVDEFESENAELRGEMTITITLADAEIGTMLLAVHEGLPAGVSEQNNEMGWNMSLGKLAALCEATSA
ncbi:MAG: SRPBCC family protein [Phycisphaerae bacterium]|nr:SRPBCC family protein [Gemmatimonadaceae bacterium]